MRSACPLCLVLLLGVGRFASAEEDWKAARLWVAGSDRQTFVVGASAPRGEALADVRMWFLGPKETRADALPKPSRYLPPIQGNPMRVGADAEALRVLFSGMATWNYYGTRAASVGVLWKDLANSPPLAWGGDAGRPVFWALVEAADLVPPETPPASHPTGEALLPDGDKPDETGIQAAPEHEVPEGRLALLRLRAGFWRTLPVLREADAGRVFWLSGRAGAAFLFWQTEAGEIRFARLGEEGWSAPESVCEAPDVVAGWAGAAAEGPVFVAGRGQAPERVELHVFARRSGAWTALGAAREGTEHAMIDARVAGVGIARGRLSVARLNHLGEVVFGSTDLTRSLLLRFSKLVPRLAPVRRDADWGETLVLILLMVVFTWVLLSRREQIHRPAAVPPGVAIAPVWKRLVGGLVDLTPAFVVLAVCTTFLKVSLLDLEDPVAAMEALDQPENARILQLTRAAFLASYGLWCLCWELATGSTPGKRLFGCHVLGDDGTAPTARQIVVRNLIRVVTMTLSPAGPLLTILLMKWYTRNRQRLGDLIAHTIVVEPGPPGAVPRARPIQRDDPSDSRDDG